VGGIPNGLLIIVGNSGIVYLELGTSMEEKGDVWAMVAILWLEVSCCGICVHIELGKDREAVVGVIAVLMSFNVLEGGAKGKIM
jgi:hypothetical protein